MSWKIFSGLKPNKEDFSFLLTLICILGCFLLAFTKGCDVLGTIIAIHGTYIAARSTEKVSAHIAASRDEKCDTRAVINDLEGNHMESQKPDDPDA